MNDFSFDDAKYILRKNSLPTNWITSISKTYCIDRIEYEIGYKISNPYINEIYYYKFTTDQLNKYLRLKKLKKLNNV